MKAFHQGCSPPDKAVKYTRAWDREQSVWSPD